MNIMLVFVMECIQEIGLCKVFGVGEQDIFSQFFIEVVIVFVSGGVIGVVLGMVIVVIVGSFFFLIIVIFFVVVVVFFIIFGSIGLFFGVVFVC